MNSNLYVCLNSFRFHNFNFILFTIVLVYNAILFVYISVLKASNQWKSTEKLVLQISKKTTFNYQDFIPTYLRLGWGRGVYILQDVQEILYFCQNSAISPTPAPGCTGCTENSQTLRVTVHSHWVKHKRSFAMVWRRGMGCSGLWKTQFFPNTL